MLETVKRRWRALQARHPSVRHAVAAWGRLDRANGNQYAAAITYWSFLALFPLLLLAVAIVGFVLASHPDLQQHLFSRIASSVPGSFGTTLQKSIDTAVHARTGIGVAGLLGVLLTGLGWIGHLRSAIDAVMGATPKKQNFLMTKIWSLAILAGLGLGSIVSLALTAVGTSLTDQLVSLVGLGHLPAAHAVLKVVGIAIAVGGDLILFLWLFSWLPAVDVPRGVAVRGALLAAVGFEILKVVGTFTIAHTANSPTAGPFAGILAVLIWIQLVSRWLLFCAAWVAVVRADAARAATYESQVSLVKTAPPVVARREAGELSPAAVGATLVGAGAVAGAAATWWLTRSAHRLRGCARTWK
ncbi:MAG: inner membrane protein YhjD [Jatrophihabitans sp.]|nr:MAG: inner membrane protein YhjD [Jatrophihabitans sp.]